MTSAPEKRSLYPAIEPFDQGYLKADDLHDIYYEQSGNPAGVPVVFLHGGPGGGAGPKHRQFFDPAHYRIIIFDQRGAGRSKPYGEIRNNDTFLLVGDIEKLRRHLQVSRWHVFGGSWGSTLALCYGIAHPGKILSLTLRGIFLMTGRELDWFLHGMGTIFTEAWAAFAAPLKGDTKNLLGYYYEQLNHSDPAIHLPAARRWAAYESACSALLPRMPEEEEDPGTCLAIARTEAHYFLKNRFNPDDYIIENIHKIRHIPAVIIQGRYDIICPFETAWRLHLAWPEASFHPVPDAGHSSSEPGILDALIRATDAFRGIKP